MNLNDLLLRQYHCLETTVDDPVMCGFVAWSRGGVIGHSPGWLEDPDCVWFRRTNNAIECVDLSGYFVLLGLECASGELAAVEPLDANHGCLAKRPPSIVMSSLPVHPQATIRKAQISPLA